MVELPDKLKIKESQKVAKLSSLSLQLPAQIKAKNNCQIVDTDTGINTSISTKSSGFK